jgi:FKBP-type peptidyl-prolyl cis-trans isomerase FkpA
VPPAPYTVGVLSGLSIEDLQIGGGAVAERRARVTIRYSGYLNRGDAFQTDQVVTFAVGERHTIAGLSRGVEGMRVGGRRRLCVGPHLAYRDKGVPGLIPPNAKLVFEVELLAVE